MQSIKSMLQGLTHEDLREWAGYKIYNRGKNYVSLVFRLSRTEDGILAAWVSGSDDYASWVSHSGQGEFDHSCTCPYDGWGPCKHSVAVLLAAAEQLKQNKEIPLLEPDDNLYLKAFDEEDGCLDEYDDDDLEDLSSPESSVGRTPKIKAMLAEKTREELESLLVELAYDIPEVLQRLQDAERLESGQVDILVRSLRKEIRSLTSENAWYNPWKGEGNLPNYSHVEQQLETLLANGHADAVLELGEELWKKGIQQVEESHDKGETADAIASCLDAALRALPQTSLTPPKQLLWLIEHELEDEYGLLDSEYDPLHDPHYSRKHWLKVVDSMEKRLKNMPTPKSGNFSSTYRREGVMNWLRKAYAASGETHKIIPLLEQGADRCRSYDLLAATLVDEGEYEQARHWCIQGFKKTIKEAPGIASRLQERLRELAETEERFDLVAAYRAEDFFERPSKKAYLNLQQAAEKIDAWQAVRNGVLDYLQTGSRPTSGGNEKKSWPVPEPEVMAPEIRGKFNMERFPNREMLIEIAILEGRLDDAVSVYQNFSKTKRWGWSIDEQLARAVAASHPDVALGIWQSIAERLIGQVKPKAYLEASGYLRQMRKVYKETARLTEWKALLMRLRTQHKAKRRLMEVLDGLEENRNLIE